MTWRRVLAAVAPLVVLTACAVPVGRQESADAPTAAASADGGAVPSRTAADAGATDDSSPAVDIEGVKATSDLPKDHVEGPVTYERMLPVGGRHSPRWLACAVYDKPVPLELAVHSLEHGGVWLAHRPGVDGRPLAQLQARDKTSREYVLVSPQDGLPAAVVAVAWGLSLEVDDPADGRLEQFVRAYAGGGQGGEPGAPCAGGGLTPAEAGRLLQPEA